MGSLRGFIIVIAKCVNISGHQGPHFPNLFLGGQTFAWFASPDSARLFAHVKAAEYN